MTTLAACRPWLIYCAAVLAFWVVPMVAFHVGWMRGFSARRREERSRG